MTRDEFNTIGRERYGKSRFLLAMHKETGVPYATLWRYSHGHTPVKPLIAKLIRTLKPPKRKEKV